MLLLIMVISAVGLSTGVVAIIAHFYHKYKLSNTLFLIANLTLITITSIVLWWLVF